MDEREDNVCEHGFGPCHGNCGHRLGCSCNPINLMEGQNPPSIEELVQMGAIPPQIAMLFPMLKKSRFSSMTIVTQSGGKINFKVCEVCHQQLGPFTFNNVHMCKTCYRKQYKIKIIQNDRGESI